MKEGSGVKEQVLNNENGYLLGPQGEYLCALGPDGALKDTRFILVRAECPYVQSVAARVISTENGS